MPALFGLLHRQVLPAAGERRLGKPHNRWHLARVCSIEPSAARVGQVCVHRGTFPASEGTIWCSPDLKDAFENPALPVEHIPGGVRLNHTRHTVLRHCSFRRMGGIGLEINGGSQHTAVQFTAIHIIDCMFGVICILKFYESIAPVLFCLLAIISARILQKQMESNI